MTLEVRCGLLSMIFMVQHAGITEMFEGRCIYRARGSLIRLITSCLRCNNSEYSHEIKRWWHIRPPLKWYSTRKIIVDDFFFFQAYHPFRCKRWDSYEAKFAPAWPQKLLRLLQRIASSIHPTFQNILKSRRFVETWRFSRPCPMCSWKDWWSLQKPGRVSVIFALHNCGPPNGRNAVKGVCWSSRQLMMIWTCGKNPKFSLGHLWNFRDFYDIWEIWWPFSTKIPKRQGCNKSQICIFIIYIWIWLYIYKSGVWDSSVSSFPFQHITHFTEGNFHSSLSNRQDEPQAEWWLGECLAVFYSFLFMAGVCSH